MGKHCTSCGNPVPAGQFRCGRCGAPQEEEEQDAELEAPPDESGRLSPVPAAPAVAAPAPATPAPAAEPETKEGVSLVESAVSLPPPPVEGEEPLEVEHASASDSGRRSDPDEFGREDDTDKRKAVPKGAFGEGSVVDALPTAADEEKRDAAPAPGAHDEATGKVARLPGLEPTRHDQGEGEDSTQAEGDEDDVAAASDEEASEEEAGEAPLELDVPSGGIRSLPHRPRPPYLASELMRGEIIPERPGAHAIARLSQSCGVGAVVMYMLIALVRPDASVWGIPALVLLAVGVMGLRFVPRALCLATLTIATLVACASAGYYPALSRQAAYLPFVVLWLSASLLLRFWYRGHRQPPWLVAVGVAGAALLGLSVLTEIGPWALTGHWQSWLPALTGVLFAQLCLLSLFAFMGPETNAAGATWALAWWGWYAAAHIILALARATPDGGHLTLQLAAEALTRSGVIIIFVLPPGAFAVAQLYAVALSRHEPAAADDAHITPA